MSNAQPVLLPGLIAVYGTRWQIRQIHNDANDMSWWTAVARPTPTMIGVLVATSLDDLADKLAKEEGQDMLAATLDDTDPGAA